MSRSLRHKLDLEAQGFDAAEQAAGDAGLVALVAIVRAELAVGLYTPSPNLDSLGNPIPGHLNYRPGCYTVPMGKPPPPRKALRRQLRDLLRASCDIQPTAAGEIPLADLDKALAVTDLVILPSPRLPGDLEVHSLRLGRLLHLESWMTARPLRGGTPAHPLREMEQGWSLLWFEHEEFIYFVDMNEDATKTYCFFRVPLDAYLAAWQRGVGTRLS